MGVFILKIYIMIKVKTILWLANCMCITNNLLLLYIYAAPIFQTKALSAGLVFTNILILRIVLFLEFSKNFVVFLE